MTPGTIPSEEDLRFYREHGWWTSPVILESSDLDDLRYGLERYYAGERDFKLPFEIETDWSPEDGEDVLRQNDYVSLQMREMRDFVERSPIARVAAALCGADEIRLFHDQLIYKPSIQGPARTAVGWHTDRAYWATCTSTQMLTAWIPFQDCTLDMGPMVVIDGSHRWPGTERLRTFHDHRIDDVRQSIAASEDEWREAAWTLRAGQVGFHHCRTIHGSRPNHGAGPRIAFAVHFQDGPNRYQPNRDHAGRRVVHTNDILCRRGPDGSPDYSDPDVCPVLWRSSGATGQAEDG